MIDSTLPNERFRFAAIAFVLVSIIAQIAFSIVTFTDTALFALMATMAAVAAAADYHMFERFSKRGGNAAQMFFVLAAFVFTFLALVVDVIRVTDRGVVFQNAVWWLPLISFVNAVISVACYLAFGLFSDSYKTARADALAAAQIAQWLAAIQPAANNTRAVNADAADFLAAAPPTETAAQNGHSPNGNGSKRKAA